MPLTPDPYETEEAPDLGTAIPFQIEGDSHESNSHEGNEL